MNGCNYYNDKHNVSNNNNNDYNSHDNMINNDVADE